VPAIDGFKPGDESVKIERHPNDTDPFAALAFKIAADPHLGRLTYIRLYSGKLEAGSTVLNSTKGRKERIGKIYQMHANKRQEIASVGAGQIVAVMGLKDTTYRRDPVRHGQSGAAGVDGLPGPGDRAGYRAQDQVRPGEAGHGDPATSRRGPDVPRHTDDETGQTIIAGMG
jgi:elongation factor G